MQLLTVSKKVEMGYIQGEVSADLAERFDAASERLGVKKKVMVEVIAELFLRLPDETQSTLTVALRSDTQFAAFMQAVDRVIAETVLARLPVVDKIAGVTELLDRLAAAAERPRSQRRSQDLRRKAGT